MADTSASARLLEEGGAPNENYHDNAGGSTDGNDTGAGPTPSRSLYALSRREMSKAVANRFVHSRAYIILYLVMAALSVTTVALSLSDGCPGLAFYVLEIIVNTAMILEVGIRFVAFGRQFWKSPFNTIDLGLTAFCVITLLVLTFAGCGATSKEEELLDTLLLVARNVLQFGRLATVMRKSGQSLFTRPKPIDLSLGRSPHPTLNTPLGYGIGSSRALDIDLSDDELPDWDEHPPRNFPNSNGGVGLGATGAGAGPAAVVFDAGPNAWDTASTRNGPIGTGLGPGVGALKGDAGDQEDMWASMG